MKYIKAGNKVSVKLTLPKDLHWMIFGQLLSDLGLTNDKANTYDLAPNLDTEYEKTLRGAVRRRSVEALMSKKAELEPLSILEFAGRENKNAYAFFAHYQAGAFLKKFPFKGIDTKAAAFRSFFAAEKQCGLFNIENHKALLALNEFHPDFRDILMELQRDIMSLLGELPPIRRIFDLALHGPGVSLGDSYKRGKSTEYYKWSNLPYSVTSGTLPYARDVISSDPRWIGALDDWYRAKKSVPIGHPINMDDFWSSVFEVVDGNRVTTVPKSFDTDRTIAIEPLLNVFLQLGVDRVIRARLKARWKYDLDDQEPNQLLALEGSISDLFATIDLKAASDSISLKICELLLPPAWFSLLLDLRSPKGEIDGHEHTYEKISSMGNGFTFALESLIFGAIARLAIRRTKSVKKSAVYGDDLIVPSTAYPYLKEVLELCGFNINVSKSFADGPFRESCGADFFHGFNVRPVFLKRRLRTVRDLFYIHNALWQLEERLHWTWCVDLSKTLALIRKYIPKNIQEQYYGPPGEALDTHLFSHRKLQRNSLGRFYWQIIARPRKFNKNTCFFFRKLMCSLRPGPQRAYNNRWDRERRLNTGNAFDVTKRDSVLLVSTRCRIP